MPSANLSRALSRHREIRQRDRLLGEGAQRDFGGRLPLVADVDQQMLVHQGDAELIAVDWTEDRHDRHTFTVYHRVCEVRAGYPTAGALVGGLERHGRAIAARVGATGQDAALSIEADSVTAA